MKEAMDIVGKKVSPNEYFPTELILSANLFKETMKIIGPLIPKSGGLKAPGLIVLGTPKGDIHDIEKEFIQFSRLCVGLRGCRPRCRCYSRKIYPGRRQI